MRVNSKTLLTIVFSLIWLGLGGCNLPAPQVTGEPLEDIFLPTAIAQTIQAVVPTSTQRTESNIDPQPTQTTHTAVPSLPPTDDPLLMEPAGDSELPAVTETVYPLPIPPQSPAAIMILAPGPASKVTSPIRLNSYLTPGDKGNVHIELLGEDGRLLVRKVLTYITPTRLQVISEVDFEISAAGELGRLTVSTYDEAGRAIAVASVDLLLLSLGESDITPSSDRLDRIIIQEPAPRTLIQGGNLRVSGFIRPYREGSIWVELINAENIAVGYRLISITEPQETGHSPFSVEIPYTVAETTWVRLTVYQRGQQIPGIVNLSSREILLSP
jgi:hypothetical protein